MSKIKIDDQPVNEELSANDAKGIVGGADVPTKATSTVVSKSVGSDTSTLNTSSNTLNRLNSAAVLGSMPSRRKITS